MDDNQFNALINALKEKALGNVIENIIETYHLTEEGIEELDSKTIKRIKNDIDTQACIKLIDIELKRRELEKDEKDEEFEKMTNDELLAEAERIYKQLKKYKFDRRN